MDKVWWKRTGWWAWQVLPWVVLPAWFLFLGFSSIAWVFSPFGIVIGIAMLVARQRGIAQTHVLGVVSVLIIARVATALLAIHENCKLDQLVVYKPVELPAGFRIPDLGRKGLGRCVPRPHLLSPSVAFHECEEMEKFFPYVSPDTGFRGPDKEIAVEPGRYRITLDREKPECKEVFLKKYSSNYELKNNFDRINDLERKSCIVYTPINELKAKYEIQEDYLPRDGNYRYFWWNKFEYYGGSTLVEIKTQEKVARYESSGLSKSFLAFWYLESLDPGANPLWSGNFLGVCEKIDLPF